MMDVRSTQRGPLRSDRLFMPSLSGGEYVPIRLHLQAQSRSLAQPDSLAEVWSDSPGGTRASVRLHTSVRSLRRRAARRIRHTGGMDGDVVTPGGIVVPARAMTWRFSRSTGPGGQGVNTTDSRVELVVDLTALVTSNETAHRVREALGDSLRIVASTERSKLRNREAAVRRLAERIDRAARLRVHRTPTRRTSGSVRRRLEAKRLRSQVKAKRRDPDEDAG